MAGKTIASKTGQVRYNVPGATGPIGPLVYPAGEYDAATKYIRTALSAPMVLDDGQYYVLNKEGAFTGIRPKDDYAQNGSNATWVLMEYVKYAFVEVLMANFAKLASAVFYGDVMMSQHGVDHRGAASSNYQNYNRPVYDPDTGQSLPGFTPNLLFNFLTGAGHLGRKNIEFGEDGTVTLKGVKSNNNAFQIDENGDVTIVGKVSTSAGGTRIVIDPDTKSIKMFNQNDKEVFSVSFMQEQWNGSTNYYPFFVMRRYRDDTVYNEFSLTTDTLYMRKISSGSTYDAYLTTDGLRFAKDGRVTKTYPAS
ncbi:hypothetical protein [Mediterranea massiliensis]|uniref:hypothetical protein n=1 Tax=Mediterranea massiliensis TaxID=1841865 RepID=UPI0025A3EA4C|nr:hypothetical protein [Mediterranea massiliensis]MDM8337214.1 hypothetical protein [Mediterranea massiliensis]